MKEAPLEVLFLGTPGLAKHHAVPGLRFRTLDPPTLPPRYRDLNRL